MKIPSLLDHPLPPLCNNCHCDWRAVLCIVVRINLMVDEWVVGGGGGTREFRLGRRKYKGREIKLHVRVDWRPIRQTFEELLKGDWAQTVPVLYTTYRVINNIFIRKCIKATPNGLKMVDKLACRFGYSFNNRLSKSFNILTRRLALLQLNFKA